MHETALKTCFRIKILQTSTG